MKERDEQPWKAHTPIEVIPSGRVMEVRDEQPWKAPISIEVIPSGRVMEERDEQPCTCTTTRGSFSLRCSFTWGVSRLVVAACFDYFIYFLKGE